MRLKKFSLQKASYKENNKTFSDNFYFYVFEIVSLLTISFKDGIY
jgi:hypothetical protein